MVASIAYIQHSVLRPWSFTGVVFIRLSMMNSMFGLLSWFLLSQADNMQTIRGSLHVAKLRKIWLTLHP